MLCLPVCEYIRDLVLANSIIFILDHFKIVGRKLTVAKVYIVVIKAGFQ